MDNKIINIPSASILIQSLRSLGYTFETAISDIVDNSITANANNIHIETEKNGDKLRLTIFDDGYGMDEKTLIDAMRYGSKENQYSRKENDLGKFGLGLKTASISQCRKLTVITKRDGKIFNYTWDIDNVLKTNTWQMYKVEEKTLRKENLLERLDKLKSGTIIVWEKFDIIQKTDDRALEQSINENLIKTESHLSLIFHRFLSGSFSKSKVFKRINIYINGNIIEGLDPFLESHKKTNKRMEIEIPIPNIKGKKEIVYARPYVLPFIKEITEQDFKLMGGKERFLSDHGFYIYRNERLIIWGTWYNLRKIDGFTKNVRIKVDIPSELDEYWGIDVKKQNAVLPSIIKRNLVSKIEESSNFAVKINKHRGRVKNADKNIEYIWNRIQNRNKIFYRVNKESTILKVLFDGLDQKSKESAYEIIKILENNLPYQQIFNDYNDDIVDETNEINIDQLETLFEYILQFLQKDGTKINYKLLVEKLSSEPFSNNEELVKRVMKRYKYENN
jgi:hypothetical protein